MSMLTVIGLWWSSKAWPWLKKWGYWLLLPLAALLLLRRRSAPVVVPSEVATAAREEAKLQEGLNTQLAAQEQERGQAQKELTNTRTEQLAEHSSHQEEQFKQVGTDPQRVNDFLKGVGARMREK